jgi:hypothetical protein
MKRILALVPAAVLVLAGCSGDTCSSNAPALQNASGGKTCTVSAGQQVTFTVAICAKCSDSSPSCQAEFLTDHFEVSPAVQQCQANSGCAVNGCNINVQSASCTVTVPTTLSGTYPVNVVGENAAIATSSVTIGSGTSCSL